MALHIDSRPTNFRQVVGNEATVEALKKLIGSDKHPHVLLFSGPTGCGKTTLARIVASKLKCSDMDLQEINSSNNRGINTARDIIANMRYAPMDGEVRVYLLDEVHQTTKDFQHALLKALEDTPDHVYFLLCTTEPTRLLKAIRNRCTEFVVLPLLKKEMEKLLATGMAKLEMNAGYYEEILPEIIREAEGSPRQALIMLDQIAEMNLEQASEIIKQVKLQETQVIELCKILLMGERNRWKQVAKILKGLTEEPERVRQAVLGYFTAVLLNGANTRAALVLSYFESPFYDSGKAGLVLACYNIMSED